MTTEGVHTQQKTEKIFLLGVDLAPKNVVWTVEEILAEMEKLVEACMGQVVGSMICRVLKPCASTIIGSGKLKDLIEFCQSNEVDTVIFSQDLKGSQQRNIEKQTGVRTIDRTQLILDIFARRAVSREGKMQVELAQLEYLLPRLVGKGTELSRLGGGIGTLGPGETKLEIDRRRIQDRIVRLKKGLQEVSANRGLKRKKRTDKGVPAVCLVGYTNAGKSTLLNALTQASQKTQNGLFTTLDSLSRHFLLPNHQRVVLSDTVGFMHALPHHLIEAFKTTLEEVSESDLLIHVVDVSHPQFRKLYDSVIQVLQELGAVQKPCLMVFNKIDQLEDKGWLSELKEHFDHAVFISAQTGENIEQLLHEISEMLSALFMEVNVTVPINRMDLVSLAHEEGEVYSIKYYTDRINIRVALPTNLSGKFFKADLLRESEEDEEEY